MDITTMGALIRGNNNVSMLKEIKEALITYRGEVLTLRKILTDEDTCALFTNAERLELSKAYASVLDWIRFQLKAIDLRIVSL
jgi:hypothetical protein